MRSPFHGPPPVLPEPIDRIAERWARLPPRLRIALVLAVLVLVGTWQASRLSAAQSRWGGEGQVVWRAERTLGAGQPVADAVDRVRLPAAAIPATAVTGSLPDGAVLAVPLVDGGVLTEVHLSPVGPAVALPDDQRAVPIPVERAWGIETGTVVDVWAIQDRDTAPDALAQARTVVQVSDDGPRPVALVAVDEDDVAPITQSLARGHVLITLRGGRPP